MTTQRRVLVTGASRGIGRAIALELAAAGFELCLNYRSGADAAQTVAEEIGDASGVARTLGFDVSDRSAAEAELAADMAAHGPYYGVVINAGVTDDAPLASMKPEAWEQVLRTNLDGFYNVLQPTLMPMVRLRQGGRIVTLSSYSGLKGNRGQTNYSASKAGLIGATRSLALEVAKRGITVNSVAPGFVQTDMLSDLPAEIVAGVPLGRVGEAWEVARLVGFLFAEGSAYITGQTLAIDGGLSV